MEKVLEHFFCNIKNENRDTLKEWYLVKHHNSHKLAIRAKLLCVDGVVRDFYRYPFSAFSTFEEEWGINLGDYLNLQDY